MPSILIADDSLFMIRVIEQMARQAGFDQINTASQGNDALASWIANHPDLTILDVAMPGLTGLEVLREIKSYDSEAVVIIATSTRDLDFESQCFNAGAAAYLIKNNLKQELPEILDRELVAKQRAYQCRA